MKNKMSVQTAIEKITYVTSNFPEEPFRILSENPQEAIPTVMQIFQICAEVQSGGHSYLPRI